MRMLMSQIRVLGPFAAPQPHAAPGSAPPTSDSFVPPQPPPRYGDPPPQPSTSAGGPSGPPPPRPTCDSCSSSESEASEAESDVSAKDHASARLADLIYEVCPDSRPLTEAAHQPRCSFEVWFGQPEPSASRSRFRLYPRVAEVESEVAARAEALARRSKPLSQIIPSRSRNYAVADRPLFAASLAVNPSFAQLAGTRTVGSRRWGSITFSEMERLERLFRAQLEMTSSSLWLMSGILALLKRDGFQPTDPTLFNVALASASATLSQQTRSSSAGAAFLRSKRRESLLAHTSFPVPEAQRKALTVSPGLESVLFNEEILGVVVAQVQQSSLISSNLAVSRSLNRGRARSSSSSPLVDPSAPGSSHAGWPHGKRAPPLLLVLVELAPLPSLGFYSRLFLVWKTSGSWRPVIDLSTLNLFVDVSHFRMETIQSVLLSVRQGDWMASIDLKEAYLQIPVDPESRRFL